MIKYYLSLLYCELSHTNYKISLGRECRFEVLYRTICKNH